MLNIFDSELHVNKLKLRKFADSQCVNVKDSESVWPFCAGEQQQNEFSLTLLVHDLRPHVATDDSGGHS